MVSALDLAKYIITKCVEGKCPISNLQLQKILYYIQAWSLKSNGNAIFDDEIEAWTFGPVVPEVYYHFCGFGASSINVRYNNVLSRIPDLLGPNIDGIDKLIQEKRKLNPWDLVEETHRKGYAWDIVYRNGDGNKDVIPKELIRKHAG